MNVSTPPTLSDSRCFQLGPWLVNPDHSLLSSGEVVHELTPMAMQVLMTLVGAKGRIVTRKELIDTIWRGNHLVGERRLNDEVWRLRAALGDDNKAPTYIKTVPRQGYVLLCDAVQVSTSPPSVGWPFDAEVGPYKVGHKLAKSARPGWFEAVDNRSGRAVQIFVCTEEQERNQLRTVAQVLSRMPRMGLTQPLDCGEQDGIGFIAYPRSDGASLGEWCRRERDPRRLARLLGRVAQTVEGMSEFGMRAPDVASWRIPSDQGTFDCPGLIDGPVDDSLVEHAGRAIEDGNFQSLKSSIGELVSQSGGWGFSQWRKRRTLKRIAHARRWSDISLALGKVESTIGTPARLLMSVFAISIVVLAGLVLHLRSELALQKSLRQAEAETALGTSQFFSTLFDVSGPAGQPGSSEQYDELLAAATRLLPSYSGLPGLQVRLHVALSNIYVHRSRYDEAERLAQRAVEIAENLGLESEFIDAKLALGYTLMMKDSADRAVKIYQEMLQRLADKTDDSTRSLQVAFAQQGIGLSMSKLGRYKEAERYIRSALATRKQILGDTHADVGKSLMSLSMILMGVNRFEEAEELSINAEEIFRKNYGNRHFILGKALLNRGALYVRMGRFEDARRPLNEGLAIYYEAFGGEHTFIATGEFDLARGFAAQHRGEQAFEHWSKGEAVARRFNPPTSPYFFESYEVRGAVEVARGDLPAARDWYLKAIDGLGIALGRNHPEVAIVEANYCNDVYRPLLALNKNSNSPSLHCDQIADSR